MRQASDMLDPGEGRRLKVFISYSRRDMAFTDWLVTALEARGLDVLIDRRNLPALEDWERELLGFVRQADTVLFVVSPHSVTSPACQWEIEQVRAHAKRLAPVVIAGVPDARIPPEIAKINYLFFTDEASFEQRADELARALNTDIAWLKEHTRLGELARRWIERGKPDDSLIRGSELLEAQTWAARRPRDAPVVSENHLTFLAASQVGASERLRRERAQLARTRRALLGAGILAVLVIGAGLVAYTYYIEATGQCSAARVYTYATGRFERENNIWTEYKGSQRFSTFRELRQDATFIYIADKSRIDPQRGESRSGIEAREFIVRIPKCGGQAEWSWSNPLTWTPFQIVIR